MTVLIEVKPKVLMGHGYCMNYKISTLEDRLSLSDLGGVKDEQISVEEECQAYANQY